MNLRLTRRSVLRSLGGLTLASSVLTFATTSSYADWQPRLEDRSLTWQLHAAAANGVGHLASNLDWGKAPPALVSWLRQTGLPLTNQSTRFEGAFFGSFFSGVFGEEEEKEDKEKTKPRRAVEPKAIRTNTQNKNKSQYQQLDQQQFDQQQFDQQQLYQHPRLSPNALRLRATARILEPRSRHGL